MPDTITDPGAYLDAVRATYAGRAALHDLYGPNWPARLDSADDDDRGAMAREALQELHRRYPTIF